MLNLTLDEILTLCREYDRIYGNFPESEYEGFGIFEFILEELNAQGKISDIELSGLVDNIRDSIDTDGNPIYSKYFLHSTYP